MDVPKISIVTPSFNQDRFIEDTIQSVLSQNYPNLEYVIIDGGSNDNSVDIIKQYDRDLHYWVSEKDEGHGHALNKGFSQTTGEIMAWINSDDKYTPWSFEVVAEIFTRFPDVQWIVGFNSWWNQNGAMVHAKRVPKNVFDFLLGRYAWIQQESVFWRRTLWENTGGYINRDYQLMVDGELWTRFFLETDLYSVDCILSGYRDHSSNRANLSQERCQQEMERAISVMKQRCSPDVIQTLGQLQNLIRIRQNPYLKSTPLARLARKHIYAEALEAAAYKRICYLKEDATWIEKPLAFSL